MAQLPTPTVSGLQFTSASTVECTVSWVAQTNLTDLDQIRIRWIRSTSLVSPTAATVRGLAERGASWGTFSSNSRSYEYYDAIDSTGLADRTEGASLSSGVQGYNIWAIARLEV